MTKKQAIENQQGLIETLKNVRKNGQSDNLQISDDWDKVFEMAIGNAGEVLKFIKGIEL